MIIAALYFTFVTLCLVQLLSALVVSRSSLSLTPLPRSNRVSVALFAETGARTELVQQDDFRFRIRELFWVTPEALNIEVLISRGRKIKRKIRRDGESFWKTMFKNGMQMLALQSDEYEIVRKCPILFIHGSFHSAWCFAENYMEYFSNAGHDCYAISLRGTAATNMPPEYPGDSVKIEDHVEDVSFALGVIRKFYEDEGITDIPAPALVAHSFGGMVAMKMMEREELRRQVSGVALLCSVPPSGNGPMTQRFVAQDLCGSLKIVWGFVLKGATLSPTTCRELFFDDTVPKEDINRYMRRFKADSRVGLDLVALSAQLPSKVSMAPNGVADWILRAETSAPEDKTTSDRGEQQWLHLSSKIAHGASASNASVLLAWPGGVRDVAYDAARNNSAIDLKAITRSTTKYSGDIKRGMSSPPSSSPVSSRLVDSSRGRDSSRASSSKSGMGGGGSDGGGPRRRNSREPPYGVGPSTVRGVYLPGRLVLGAERDFIVDQQGVRETARYFGLGLGLSPGAGHGAAGWAGNLTAEHQSRKPAGAGQVDPIRKQQEQLQLQTLHKGRAGTPPAIKAFLKRMQTLTRGVAVGNGSSSSSIAGEDKKNDDQQNDAAAAAAVATAAQQLEEVMLVGPFKDRVDFEQSRKPSLSPSAAALHTEGSGAVLLRGLYHDVMLGPKWKSSAEVLSKWLDAL